MTLAAKLSRIFVLLLLTAGLAAHAQVVGGTIDGLVHDASGAAVSGATVVVRQAETGASRTLTTDADGRFFAPSLPVGPYAVSVAHDGFETQQHTGISLTVGQSLALNFVLGLATVQQQVVVVDSGNTVNTTTQQTAGLVDERQVKELPLNGRSYDELLTLNPATVNYSDERSGGIGSSNSSVGNMFSVSGRRPQDNLFLLNGIEYTGASLINVTPGGTSGELLGVDAVREFNVVTDTYGAEYGKRDGAQVSIVTSSGTNQLHGTAFEFLRNSALDARNYFDQGSIPEFQRNQFGGSLGGPIRKDKLFLFGNYEGFRQKWGLSAVTLVPDNQARQGYLPNSSGAEQYVGVNAAVAPLLGALAAQNGPELGSGIAEAFSHPPQHIREDFGTTRFDDNLSSKDLLFAVYTVDDSAADTPSQNPLSLINESLREQVASVQEQQSFRPRSSTRPASAIRAQAIFFTGYSPVSLPGGFPASLSAPSSSAAAQLRTAPRKFPRPGLNVGSNNNSARNLFTWDDHVYWSHGRNQVEAGVWLQRIQSNDLLAQDQYGQASFSTLAIFPAGHSENLYRGSFAHGTRLAHACRLGLRRRHGQARARASSFAPDSAPNPPTAGTKRRAGRPNYAIVSGVLQTQPIIGGSALTKNNALFPSRAARRLRLGRMGQRQDCSARRLRALSRLARHARLSPRPDGALQYRRIHLQHRRVETQHHSRHTAAGRHQGFPQQRATRYRHPRGTHVEPARGAAGRAAHFAHGGLCGLAQLSPDPL